MMSGRSWSIVLPKRSAAVFYESVRLEGLTRDIEERKRARMDVRKRAGVSAGYSISVSILEERV